jgi:hypothetical protein
VSHLTSPQQSGQEMRVSPFSAASDRLFSFKSLPLGSFVFLCDVNAAISLGRGRPLLAFMHKATRFSEDCAAISGDGKGVGAITSAFVCTRSYARVSVGSKMRLKSQTQNSIVFGSLSVQTLLVYVVRLRVFLTELRSPQR